MQKLDIQRWSLANTSFGTLIDSPQAGKLHMTPNPMGEWCQFDEACAASSIAKPEQEFLLLEKQILKDLAALFKYHLITISRMPTATMLLPMKQSLEAMAEQVRMLEELAK